MKKYKISLWLGFLTLVSCSQTSNLSSGNANSYEWQYELEAQNTGNQGTYLIKVWSYSGNSDMDIEKAQKNAVHGVLFKGFPDNERINGQKALIRDKEIKENNDDYFSEFFKDGGPYQRYVNLVSQGDHIKIESSEDSYYKIGTIVSVNVADLRKHLEDDRIIKSLNAGF